MKHFVEMAIMLMQIKLFCLQVDSYFPVFKELFTQKQLFVDGILVF